MFKKRKKKAAPRDKTAALWGHATTFPASAK
jgi:hypothetical protein